MHDHITRREVEKRARDYLERARDLRPSTTGDRPGISPGRFEEIVKKEVDETIRQLRGVGKRVVD